MGCGIITGSLLLSWSDFRVIFGVSLLLSLTLVGFALSFRPLSVSVEPLSRYLRDLATRRVFLFVIALVLFCLHWGAEITCYSPFLKDNLGIGTASAGLFMGLPIIFLACCSYYFGWRRDRGESSIRLAILAIALSGTGLILFSATRTPLISFLFRLVHEAGDAAFTVFSYIGIARLFPRQRVGGTSGSMIVVMIGAQSAGALLFSWMGGAFGYAAPYIVAGSCSLASIPLILYSQRHYRFEPLPRE
jgi:predicted MFS family arabinose efflux permease